MGRRSAGAIRALFARNEEEQEGPKMMGREDVPTTLNPSLPLLLPDNFCLVMACQGPITAGFICQTLTRILTLSICFPSIQSCSLRQLCTYLLCMQMCDSASIKLIRGIIYFFYHSLVIPGVRDSAALVGHDHCDSQDTTWG